MPVAAASDRPKFVIDGLNVCRYTRLATTLSPLLTLLSEISKIDRAFVCAFDGVTPHRLSEDERLTYGRLLDALPDHFYEITGGIEADEFILMQADVASAQVISNDRFKKYVPRYAWLDDNERLIKGHVIRRELFLPALGISAPLVSDVEMVATSLVALLMEPRDLRPRTGGNPASKLRRYRQILEQAELQDLARGD